MGNISRITSRELRGYFGSPVAYLFMAAFLGVTLFVFFWVETFFSRNVAEIRPLFEWMPLLLIFLVATLTMRGWSEEKRSGTLELLLTAPRSGIELVLGKFFGCLGLVAVTVLLTVPLAITVSLLGPLDWGPVIGGYLATLLLASAYIALGLFISALTDNQIISLIGTLIVGLILYFLGAPALTELATQSVAGLLTSLGTGARFDSITRGVLDLRDLVYYLSLTLLFLTLNVYALERLRWACAGDATRHRRWHLAAALMFANALLVNVWLAPITSLRADLTKGNLYSLSETTTTYLHQLHEPLLIRAYFSGKTHPLLAPLVPQLRDLIHEYGVRGGDHVKVEVVDPQNDPHAAEAAASRFGIKPVPFRTQSRYQAAVVNAYFDVLVKYGNQHQVLRFGDLIKIQRGGGSDVRVVLNDPEYRITSAVKKVVSDYRRAGNLFAAIDKPVTLKAFVSAHLPDQIAPLREALDQVTADLRQQAGDKLKVVIQDPGAPGSDAANKIVERYGFQPFSVSLLGNDPFFFNLVLERGDQRVPVPLPDDLNEQGLRDNLDAGLTRFVPGLLNTIALYTPPRAPSYPGLPADASTRSYTTLKQALSENALLRDTDLSDGSLPPGTDLLLVLAPHDLTDRQLFTIDQFLMSGGTTVIAGAPFDVDIGQQGLSAQPHDSGLETWLADFGVKVGKTLVLDPINASFPIPVMRNLGGIQVREYLQTDYPYFADVRAPRLAGDSVITSNLGQLTLTWAAPITLDSPLPDDLKAKTLMSSSAQSWLSDSTNIMPTATAATTPWQAPDDGRGSHILGTVVSGRFQSYFQDHDNPMLNNTGDNTDDDSEPPALTSVIRHSPADTHLVLFSSGTFLSDTILRLQGLAAGQPYEQPIQLLRNTLDWALEDPALLALRDQTRTSRILQPLDDGQRRFWEYLNYGLALLGLIVVFLIARQARRLRERRFLHALNEERS